MKAHFQSFLSVESDNLIVTAVKKSGENILIRFYEAEGREVEGKLRFFKPINRGNEMPVRVRPFEILNVLLEALQSVK